jgi:tetratricopeptide (TPR) repeat protein
MLEFTLDLHSGVETAQAACAWYIGSRDCQDWLREIAGWKVRHSRVSLVPIPSSRTDGTVAGALILVEESGVVPSARCVPYCRIAHNVYVPINADLRPVISERELESLLEHEYVYAWHPGVGLVAAESSDVLRVCDLVAPLRRGNRSWSRAVPGVAINERLMMLMPIVELSFEQLINQSRDDIGTEQSSISDLPESPTEPGNNMLDRAGRAIGLGMASMLYGLIKSLPGGGSAAWLDRMREMAAARIERLMTVQEELRHKEISRLLHMLEHDPDQGLKFALPFSNLAHRGVAPPSNRLGRRELEFDLQRLGKGQPADYWDLGAKYQRQLLTKYRELANRELSLGRYRRAAYIFAELLNDLESAASALADGQFYREAALIYRDRLHRQLEAAKCLENGGLWSEAIEQFDQLKMHERVGTLYERLEDKEKAAAAYRRAADRFRSEGDFLSAARVWEERLSDREQAAEELLAGWPNSAQAIECIRALFALFGRTGQHAAAAKQIGELEQNVPSTNQFVRTAEVLCDVAAGKYPDVVVRERAAAATQRVVSQRLRAALRSEGQSLVAALSRLAPHDRLLDRDCRRFAADLPAAKGADPARVKLKRVKTFNVQFPGELQTAAVVGEVVVAAGIVQHRVVLRRFDFRGNLDSFVAPWTESVVRSDTEIVLAAGPYNGKSLGVYPIGIEPLPWRNVYPVSDMFSEPISAGAFSDTGQTIGIACGSHGRCYSVDDKATPLIRITTNSNLLGTLHLSADQKVDWENAHIPLPMHARREHLYVAVGRHLLVIRQSTHDAQRHEFGSTIRQVSGSAEHSRSRIVLGLSEGACILWDPVARAKSVTFATHMLAPRVGINRGGYVIAAAGNDVEIYDSKEDALRFVAACHDLSAPPLAVLIGSRTDQFAIMCENGEVVVFGI